MPAEDKERTFRTSAGSRGGLFPFGTQNPNPPPSPWSTKEEAERRNQVLLEEYLAEHAVGSNSATADA
jgi:hypothetical protein